MRADGDMHDGKSPAKRLRIEDTHSSLIEDGNNGVESPTQIADIQDEEPIEIAPAPVVDDLYLETVHFAHEIC